MNDRPKGILILSVLCIVLGALMIVGGVSVMFLASKFANTLNATLNATANAGVNATNQTVLGTVNLGENATQSLVNQLKVMASIYGILFIIPGILLVITGVGFYKRFWWSWWLGLIIAGFVIVTKINSTTALTVLAAALMIYYLTRPQIKGYFGIKR